MRIYTLRDRRASPLSPVALTLATLLPVTAAHAADPHRAATPAPPDSNAGSDMGSDMGSPQDGDADSLTIGAGVAYLPSYEGSNDYIATPIAALRAHLHGIDIATRGTQVTADLARDAPGPGWKIALGPAINLNLNRNGRIVDPQVRALGRRHAAFEVGGIAGISRTGVITSRYDTLGIRVIALHDVSGVNHSYTVTPSIDYGTPLSRRAYVMLSASATFAGDRYARTYFGVDPAGSAASGLPVFANPRGGLKSYGVTALATRSLTGDLRHGLGIYAGVSYSRLQGDFAASPLVRMAGSASQWIGGIGLGYTF